MQSIAELQQQLMPKQVPVLEGWAIATHYLVNGLPGGDYYDCLPLADGRLALIVADASGHGGAAAVMVAQVRTFLHSCPLTCGHSRAPFCAYVSPTPPVGVVLGQLSRLLEENSLPDEFMTAYYGVLASRTGTFQYANAGHPPPRWWRAAHGTVEAVPNECAGPPLGLSLCARYSQDRITVEPGDVLVLYTDGLVDARRRPGEPFTVSRIDAALREGAGEGAKAVQRKLMDSWNEFVARKRIADDVTLVVLERRAPRTQIGVTSAVGANVNNKPRHPLPTVPAQ
jgi:sigma-B regulation protein RsbU (phosphoserine phosphatase)